jgi:poly(glycerol-phosphate) alpha-glucosyltransferase
MIGPIFGAAKGAALRAASAFILPSFSEGLPMSILEAWSYSLPVLMTKECNLTEGFDASAAVKIGTGATEIANPLQEFMRLNEDHRKTLGQNGFELVQRRFTWVRIAENFSRVYASLARENQVPLDLLAD